MVETKDSSEKLGKAIGDDFDKSDGEDEDADEDESNDSGGKDKTSEGETDDEGSEGKEDDEDKEDKPSTQPQLLTEDGELTPEAQAIVDKAVSSAVGAVNSTKDKAAAEAAKEARQREENLLQERENGSLNGLEPAARTARQGEIDNARERRALAQEKLDVIDMSRIANSERLSVDNARFGVTFDELRACNTPEEQEAIVASRKATYWQRVAEGKQALDADADDDTTKAGSKKNRGKSKKDAPAGSKKKTDTGSRGSAPASGKATPGNTLDSFAQGLIDDGVVPSKGITEVKA